MTTGPDIYRVPQLDHIEEETLSIFTSYYYIILPVSVIYLQRNALLGEPRTSFTAFVAD